MTSGMFSPITAKPLRRLAALAVLTLLAACAVPPAPPGPPVEATAGQLLEHLQDPENPVRSLRGLARLRIADGDRSASMNQVVLAAYPDRLRTESLSLFGSPALILTAADGRLQVLVPGEGRFLQGPATPENLGRFIRLPLRLADLVGLLLHRPPVLPWEEAAVERNRRGGLRLVLTGPERRRQVFTFDTALRLIGAAYFQEGEPLLAVEYADFTATEPVFPRHAELAMPAHDLEASLDFGDDPEINPVLAEERFHQDVPEGVTVERLGY